MIKTILFFLFLDTFFMVKSSIPRNFNFRTITKAYSLANYDE